MPRGVPELIHELTICCFENHISLTIQSIDDKKGNNLIEHTDESVNITLYASDEDDVNLAKEIEQVLNSLKSAL